MNILNELTVEVLQKCPNFCMHCSSLSSLNAKAIINKEDVLNVSTQAFDLGLKRLSISGGEPLYHPEILEIVESVVSIGLHVSLYTTGLYPGTLEQPVSFDRWNDFCRNKTRLIFSVQSTNHATHDKISGRAGALSLTKASILSAIKQGFDTEIHLVPNKINLHEIEQTIDDLVQWGVNQVSFLRLVPQGYAYQNKKELVFDNNDIEYFSSLIERLNNKDYGKTTMRFGIPFSHELKQKLKCHAAESKLIIRYDGKVLPCEAFKDARFSEYILGDIYNNKLIDLLKIGKTHKALNRLKGKICFCESCPAQVQYKAIA